MSAEGNPPQVRITQTQIEEATGHALNNIPNEKEEQVDYLEQLRDALDHTQPDAPAKKADETDEDDFPF